MTDSSSSATNMFDHLRWPDYASTILLLLAGAGLLAWYARRTENGPFPPGPKPQFLIGNALDIPFKQPGQKYLEFSKQLGSSILHFYALGNRIMVLNSREDAEELFDRRAAIYSDRPEFATIDMLGFDYGVALLPDREPWRLRRRICHQAFKAQTASKYYPVQIRKVHDMLAALLDTPERFIEHSKIGMFGVKKLDPISLTVVIEAADRSIELGMKVLSPGGSLVNLFPPLKYIPWTWTQRMAKEVKHLTRESQRIPMESLTKDMANGKAIPSFMGEFLEKKQTVGATPEEEKAMLDIAISIYVGASDTTISATKTLVYQLVMHPEIQSRAQAELDKVIGSPPRLPTFEDRSSLPYIEAIYREVLRWLPPLSIGVPHCNTQDDWYKGYFIPKGTTLFPNIWAMNRDTKRYGSDSYEFNPERFFNADGKLNDNDRILAYGFGRRVCVGQHVASSTMWLIIASLLACFNIQKPKDKQGNEIEINHDFDEDGILSHKLPFECDFVPRSSEWRDLIDSTRNKGYQST